MSDNGLNNICQLYLVRHGATDNNLMQPPRLQGQRVDALLSSTGLHQAEQTARALAELAIAAVYASPLLRAVQTAEVIARPHELAVVTVPELVECDVGDWEGLTWPAIQQAEPEAYRLFHSNAYEHGYRGGENLRQVEQRAMPALHAIAAKHVGQVIVIVAHNVVNRVFLGHLLGVPPALRRHVPQDNCGLNLVRFNAGQPTLATLNGVFHLRGN